MVSPFRAQWAAGQGRLDNAFGEQIEIRRVLAGNQMLAGRPDPAVPPFVVIGILDLPTLVVRPGGILDGARSAGMITDPTVDFDAAQFSADRPAPRKGDRIVAVEQPGAPAFVVDSDPRNDGIGRVSYTLAKVPA